MWFILKSLLHTGGVAPLWANQPSARLREICYRVYELYHLPIYTQLIIPQKWQIKSVVPRIIVKLHHLKWTMLLEWKLKHNNIANLFITTSLFVTIHQRANSLVPFFCSLFFFGFHCHTHYLWWNEKSSYWITWRLAAASSAK